MLIYYIIGRLECRIYGDLTNKSKRWPLRILQQHAPYIKIDKRYNPERRGHKHRK